MGTLHFYHTVKLRLLSFCLIWLVLFMVGTWVFFGQSTHFGASAFREGQTNESTRGPHAVAEGPICYAMTRSMVLDADLSLKNEQRDLTQAHRRARSGHASKTPKNVASESSHWRPSCSIGIPALWSPGFLFGHVVERTDPRRYGRRKVHGFGWREISGALYVSFIAAFFALILGYIWCRKYYSVVGSLLGALGAGIGGPLVWYAIFEPSLPFALEAMLTALFLLLVLPFRSISLPTLVAQGAVGGAMLLVRPENIFLLAIPIVGALSTPRNEDLDHLHKPWLDLALGIPLYLLSAAIVFAPQIWVWHHHFGQSIVVPEGLRLANLKASLWSPLLFSPQHGLLPRSPLLWLALPGLFLFARRQLGQAGLLILMLASQIVISGADPHWTLGNTFGSGCLAVCTPFFAVLLAACFDAILGLREEYAAIRGRHIRFALATSIALVALVTEGMWVKTHRGKQAAFFHEKSGGRRPLASLWVPQKIYRLVGNPFSLPASALFATQRAMALHDYDRVHGPYFFADKKTTHEVIDLTTWHAIPIRGRGLTKTPQGLVLKKSAAELLLMLNRTAKTALTLSIETPRETSVDFSLNGKSLGRIRVVGRQRISLFAKRQWIKRGLNIISITGEGHRILIDRLEMKQDPQRDKLAQTDLRPTVFRYTAWSAVSK